MTTRITAKGQLVVPRRVREALQLSPGDTVEFQLNGGGEAVLRKAPAGLSEDRRSRRRRAPLDAQMRRRAAELLALLHGLD